MNEMSICIHCPACLVAMTKREPISQTGGDRLVCQNPQCRLRYEGWPAPKILHVPNWPGEIKVMCEDCHGSGRIRGRQGMGVPVAHARCGGRGWYILEVDNANL
jgi:hypothetical protein